MSVFEKGFTSESDHGDAMENKIQELSAQLSDCQAKYTELVMLREVGISNHDHELSLANAKIAELEKNLDAHNVEFDKYYNSHNKALILLSKSVKKVKIMKQSILGAIGYMESCGYDKYEECDPESHMLKDFKEALAACEGLD